MDIKDMNSKEADLLRQEINKLRKACKEVYEYSDYISLIKESIRQDDLIEASALWNELEYSTQKYLFIAPTKGGVFTTEERKVIRGFWEISAEDI
jgi:hypothetical protein